jgi:hypothetical protein
MIFFLLTELQICGCSFCLLDIMILYTLLITAKDNALPLYNKQHFYLKSKHEFKYFVTTPGFLLRFFPKDGSVSLSYMGQVVEENNAFCTY